MAQPPPRPASSRAGGPAGGTPASSSGPRPSKGGGPGDKEQATFFLGRYRVVDEIGVGGMASVHLGRMDGPGGFQKWVAIKRIHPHLVEDDQFVDMFLDEARIAASINHANVAQVFDLGKDDNTYWIAMEYLHGEPLREVMRRSEDRGTRISPELAARICSDAAEGLHAAHELRGKNGQLLGLVHRDVTPHNLFLTYDGYTKVVDFGIAKVADRLSSTRAGTLKGKLAYMSPEQVRGAEVDRTTDIFALGVVLWEVTTNQRLFRMDTDLDTLEKVQACIVPPPSTIIPGYPMELEACLMKALAKRKQDRYATAREFSRALQSYLVRSGSFVGPEEVSNFVKTVFADRIVKREAHLAWAAEVTSNVNIDALRASKGATGEEASLPGRDEGPKPAAGTPASGARPVAQRAAPPAAPMASQSLMDDDEDVPTTVAMREALEARSPNAAPRPAAGLPAPQQQQPQQQQPFGGGGPSPASYAGQASYAANAARQPQGYGQPSAASYAGQASYAANAARQQPPQQQQSYSYQQPPQQQSPEDLGSTVALPSNLNLGPPEAGPGRPPPYGGGYGGQNNGQQQQPQYGGFPQGGPAPQFGQSQNPQLSPPGMVGGVPVNLPPINPNGPQSQIETALSLPRPDPAALWLAQQEKQKGERRNTGVLIAVVALTALCVIGIGALVYFKLRQRNAVHATADAASAAVSAVAAPSGAPAASAAPAPTASATADAAPTASASASAAPTAAPSGQPAAKPAGSKEDPGFLTIVCNPYCDDVLDQGKSLGPSPVVRYSVTPGQHRITLKKSGQSKVISVIVVSGQVTAQRVSMK
jgi:serine/threonine-protein kinase